MSYADMIEQRLLTLPENKQAEVFDFVEFLAARNQIEQHENQLTAKSALNDLMRNPLKVADFTPLNREDANAR